MRQKKGFFFTFIAITIMAVSIILFTPQSGISLERNEQAVKQRISSIDNYVGDLSNVYFENVLRAASYKGMLSLIYYIDAKRDFIPQSEFDRIVSQVVLNGTISEPIGSENNVIIDSITGRKIMENNSLLNWSRKINETSKETLNVDSKVTVLGLSVSQKTPWNIESTINVSLLVMAEDISARWEKNLTISANISIEGFLDPYYIVRTNGIYKPTINKSNVKFNQWNINRVIAHIDNGNYTHWEDSKAPDFLMRFTGVFSASKCCGIESFVNPAKLAPSDKDKNKVYVDYLFWDLASNPKCPTPIGSEPQLYSISDIMPQMSGFKLDIENVNKYKILDHASAC